MIFERFEAPGLAHYSYLVACRTSRSAVVVDPQRDVDTYLDYTKANSLTITHIFETHIHADYASGACELAQRTSAPICVSAYDRSETYEAAFPHRDLHDGDTIEVGSVRLRVMHTPGHTPEHISFLVFDTAKSAEQPAAILSGDFLFIGSLGRPDLLGDEAKRGLAGRLFESVRDKLTALPDVLAVCPAHGAGSMCGAGMAKRSSSTLGDERAGNPYLKPGLAREQFIDILLANSPPFPPYYRRMKKLNAAGPRILDGLPGTQAIDAARFKQMITEGCTVIDLRDQLAFGAGHIPNSLGIGLGANLSTWAAWVVPYDTPMLFVTDDETRISDAVRAFVRVGLDDVRGYLKGGIATWSAAGHSTQTTEQIQPAALHQRLTRGDDLCVLDVRQAAEFAGGHISGAMHIMCGELAEQLERVPRGRPIAVACGGGYRSTIAASVLERAGFEGVINVTGGMGAWQRAGLPTTIA